MVADYTNTVGWCGAGTRLPVVCGCKQAGGSARSGQACSPPAIQKYSECFRPRSGLFGFHLAMVAACKATAV